VTNNSQSTRGKAKGKRLKAKKAKGSAFSIQPLAFSLAKALAVLLFCLISAWPVAAADTSGVKEHQVKAAFVYNFMKFVEWPASRLDNASSPLIIGVAGKGRMFATLEAAVKGRTINGRALIVKSLAAPEDARGMHALFVDASEDARVEAWLRTAAGSSGILTVGESEAFAKHGGMINFVLEGDKLHFEINADSADQAGLKISAQLLKLAKKVSNPAARKNQ